MKMMFQTVLKGAVLAAACLVVVNATTGQAGIMLTPHADARLANDSNRGPTSNTGSSDLWEVRWHSAPRVRIGYVRYDITGVDPALYSTATLSGTFTASSYNGPGDGSGMWNVYGLSDGGGVRGGPPR